MLCKLMNTRHVYTVCMGPTPNGCSVLQHFERSNALKIHNGIMFDFYLGLPQLVMDEHDWSITTKTADTASRRCLYM